MSSGTVIGLAKKSVSSSYGINFVNVFGSILGNYDLLVYNSEYLRVKRILLNMRRL